MKFPRVSSVPEGCDTPLDFGQKCFPALKGGSSKARAGMTRAVKAHAYNTLT